MPAPATSSANMSNPESGARMASEAKPAPACILVIFGAAGDLTKRLLLPALYNLRRSKLLPREFAVIGVARAAKTDEEFRTEVRADFGTFATDQLVTDDVRWFSERTYYLRGDFDDPTAYTALARKMTEVAQHHRTGENCLFYLATPPQVFTTIVDRLGQAGLTSEADGRWRRVIIEKPFGTDLQSARALNRHLLGVLGEGQIYRI